MSRRGVLSGGVFAAGGALLAAVVGKRAGAQSSAEHGAHGAPQHHPHYVASPDAPPHARAHGPMISVGDVDNARNGFDPAAMLTDWDDWKGFDDYPTGARCAPSKSSALDKEIEIAPGVFFPAWTYQRPRAGS